MHISRNVVRWAATLAVSLLGFAVVWEILSHLSPCLGIPPFAIPSLLRIAKSITTITPIDVAVTLARVIAALIVSFVLGRTHSQ